MRSSRTRPSVELLEGRLLPTAYTVNTTNDILGDTTPGEVTLRDALTAIATGLRSGHAAAGGATNSIDFAIPGPGPRTILVGGGNDAEGLPALNRQVFLDGWSQGPAGYRGPPLVVLNGAAAGGSANGLTLAAGSDGSTVRGLAIQQFGGNGIELDGTGRNLIAGDFLGTDAAGAAASGNGGAGVAIDQGSAGNTVGGTAAGSANVLSANGTDGVDLQDAGTSGNVVLGNLIGTDRTGAAPLGNGHDGVYVLNGAAGNTLGGTAAGAGNVISANQSSGVEIDFAGTSGNAVLGNLIGTDRTGTRRLGNATAGVLLFFQSTANTIGGTAAGAGNVISANGGNGVEIDAAGTSGNAVLGNRVGTDVSGTKALGNVGDGVFLSGGAAGNTVGGTAKGSGNVLAFNANGVVLVDAATVGDSVLGNSVFGNVGPGIDLGDDGHTANGPNPRAFPNDGQNAPVVTAVAARAVSFTLSSSPHTSFRVELFGSPSAGPAFQGGVFLGFAVVSTGAAGTLSYTAPVAAVPGGDTVTATATNLTTGDTSEFSQSATRVVVASPVVGLANVAQVVTFSLEVLVGSAPAVGGQVVVSVAGVARPLTARVGSDGVAQVTVVLPAGMPVGQYAITASYLGTPTFLASKGVGVLTIGRGGRRNGL